MTTTSHKGFTTFGVSALLAATLFISHMMLPSTSRAADATGEYSLRGVGVQTCQAFLDALETKDPVRVRPFIAWMDGYISATSRQQALTYDATPVLEGAAMGAMARAMCVSSPTSRFETAIANLVVFFKPFRVQKNSPLVEVSVDGNYAVVRKETLKWMQEEMIFLGYFQGDADGIFGGNTRKALGAFQSANGLQPTQIPDPDTVIKFVTSAAERDQP